MTELSFAKSFLSTLDARVIKLQSDHAADLKTLELKGAEVVGEEGAKDGEVELGVMVVGGATTAPAGSTSAGNGGAGEDVKMGGVEDGKGEVPVAQGPSGEEVMGTAEFWDDLKGWLMQRVRDEGKAEEAWSLFKRGWDER
ncbi:MAG: hypothetical protein Q9166_004873 [cf. Caloplaca sp. 2 TL-2023]